MDYLKKLLSRVTGKRASERVTKVETEFSRMYVYYNAVYRILSWENPQTTWSVLFAIHILFWAIVYYQIRLYGVVFLASLVCFLTDFYFDRIGLTAPRDASSEAIDNVLNVFKRVFSYMKGLRGDNQPLFCICMCTLFFGLSIVSKNVPGIFLAYLTILFTFFVPLIVKRIPERYKRSLSDTIHSLSTNEGELDENELIPFIADKDLNMKDPELESLLTDKTADSITNSLISGITSMPSHLECDGSADDLDEDDLLPAQLQTKSTLNADTSDSDSDHRNLRFESGHFKDSSSSDDEANYAAGLRFAAGDATDASPATIAHTILDNLVNVGARVVSTVLNQVGEAAPPPRQDSDSDFEFINKDELERY